MALYENSDKIVDNCVINVFVDQGGRIQPRNECFSKSI